MNELLSLAWEDFLSFALVSVRVGIIFTVLPFFGAELIPRRIMALVTLFLSLIIMPVVPAVSITPDDLDVFLVVQLLVHELLIGVCLGLALRVIFSGLQLAGQLIGFQMGFAIANVIDPTSGENVPITANLLYLAAFLIFLSIGGHHQLIRALVDSFTLIPVATALPQQAFLSATVSYGVGIFVIALKAGAPVIATLLLLQTAFAVSARAIPQMNIMLMSFPITITIGLVGLIVVIRLLPPFMEGVLRNAWEFIRTAMGLF